MKYYCSMLASILAVVVLSACGGGGNSSPSTSSSSSSAPLAEVKIQGVVSYGSPLANADVTVTAGATIATAKTDATGKYAVTIKAPAADAAKLVKAVARGTGVQSEIELASQLPSLTVLIQQAGSDKVLESSENFDVNITNLTTAQYSLLLNSDNPTLMDVDLEAAKFLVSGYYQQKLAALLQLIIERPEYQLPAGVTSTLELVVTHPSGLFGLLDFLENDDKALLQSTIDSFADNANLVKPANNNLSVLANVTDAGLAKCLNQTGANTIAEVLFMACDSFSLVSLAGLDNLVNLRGINITNNRLSNKALDLSKNPKLEYLFANYNDLTSVNLQANPALTYIDLYFNQLKAIDLSKNPKLERLGLGYNPLADLDVRTNTKLQVLDVSGTKLNILDLTALASLRRLGAYFTPLQALDLSKNPMLTDLAWADFGPSYRFIDLSQNTKMEHLTLMYIPLMSLDISRMPDLKMLRLFGNELSYLNLANNKNLEELDISSSRIANLDLSQQTQLKSLTLKYNELMILDLSKNTKLTYANLESNGLVSVSGLENIEDKSVEADLTDNSFNQNTIDYLLGLEKAGFTNLTFDHH